MFFNSQELIKQVNRHIHSFTFPLSIETILCDKVCQWMAAGWLFSPGTLVSSTYKTDCHNITEILLKVALNTIILTLTDLVLDILVRIGEFWVKTLYKYTNLHKSVMPEMPYFTQILLAAFNTCILSTD